MIRILSPAFVLLFATSCPVSLARDIPPGPKERLKIGDLFDLDAPTQPALAPDGRQVAYSRHWFIRETRQERYSLWTASREARAGKALETNEPDARAPVFSPDGKRIAFYSTRPRPDGWKATPAVPPSSDPAVDIWIIPAEGGTAIPLSGPSKPYGRAFNDGFYGRLAFSPDGKRLAFVADAGEDPRTRAEIENDVEIVRPDQGEGYTGYGPAQIWIAQLDDEPGRFAARRIERLTEDDVWHGDPQWSPDAKTIYVHANATDDRESVRYSINKNYDIWSIDVGSRKAKRLTSGAGPEVSPRVSPDGRRIACLSVPRKGSHRDVFNLAIIDLAGSQPTTRILFNHHSAEEKTKPHPEPFFPLPQDCWESDGALCFTNEAGTGSRLIRLDVATGKGEVAKPSATGASRLLERLHLRGDLLPAANPLLARRELGEAKVIQWKSFDDYSIEGILTLPPASLGLKAPHRLVVFPHGGPHSRASMGFDFTVQILAAHGYAVFQPNFRGSSGYGQKFIDADRFDLGGGDMKDILAGVDHLIQNGVADKSRLFLQGTSYGGFMTCWLVGQTSRFRAAVAINAVTDLNMMWGLTDIQSWTTWEFGGRPWEVPEKMRQHSPITHAARVRTPTLILHSRDDRRCPLPMGQAYHQALRANHVVTEMVIYPGEGHGIRQPKHRVDVLERMLAWFEKHGK